MTSYQNVKEAILRVAARGHRFQADDVRAELPELPANRNLIGLAFQHLAGDKRILPVGNTVSQAQARAGGSQRQWIIGTPQGQTQLENWSA
jgi:hypothetical protein